MSAYWTCELCGKDVLGSKCPRCYPEDPYEVRMLDVVQQIEDLNNKIIALQSNFEEISYCPHCFCMTKTIDERCGKCKELK